MHAFGVALATFFKLILRLIWTGLKIVYFVLRLLRIRVLTLYLAVWAVLQLGWKMYAEHELYFWIGFGVCALFTALSWCWYFYRKRRKARRLAEKAEKKSEEEKK